MTGRCNRGRHWFTMRGRVGVPAYRCGCGAINPNFDKRLEAIGWNRIDWESQYGPIAFYAEGLT